VSHAPRYGSLDEMWSHAVLQLLFVSPAVESRAGGTLEQLGFVGRLTNVRRNVLWNEVRLASPIYAAAELLWYLSGSADGAMIRAYAPQYEGFLDDKGVAYGAYGRRWAEHAQLEHVIGVLREKRASRQAVVVSWEARDLAAARQGGCRDVPCTLALQFLLRDGELNLVATMRSNDVWLGMPYDVFCFTVIQQLIAAAVGAEPGWYQHQAGSLHLYDQHRARASEAVNDINRRDANLPSLEFALPPPPWSDWGWESIRCDVLSFVIAEATQRNRRERCDGTLRNRSDWLAHCVALTGMEHDIEPVGPLDQLLIERAELVLERRKERVKS